MELDTILIVFILVLSIGLTFSVTTAIRLARAIRKGSWR